MSDTWDCPNCGDLENYRDSLIEERNRLEARIAKLEAALEDVEWVSSQEGPLECAWCGAPFRDREHKPDCARQLALKGAHDTQPVEDEEVA